MTKRWRIVAGGSAAAMVAGALLLSGCELLALAGGKGTQAALYQLPKGARVLVLVDVQEGITLPPLFATNLGDKISEHLFRYKAADRLVGQDRLLALQQDDPAAYKKMSIAEVARAVDADAVVYVNISQMETPSTTDGLVTWGNAAADVKVVDKQGANLWPGTAVGTHVAAKVEQALSTDRDQATAVKLMIDQLTKRTGKMFHSYSLDDKDLANDRE